MEKVQKKKFKYLVRESYLVFIKNSVGTRMFRNFFVLDEKNKKFDVLKNGQMSCAFFVSTVLKSFGLIRKPHFTVGRTVEDLLQSKAKKVRISDLKPGDVLVYESISGKSGNHNHIGFYLGNNLAVSNSEFKKMVVKHHYKFKGKRQIELALRPKF